MNHFGAKKTLFVTYVCAALPALPVLSSDAMLRDSVIRDGGFGEWKDSLKELTLLSQQMGNGSICFTYSILEKKNHSFSNGRLSYV